VSRSLQPTPKLEVISSRSASSGRLCTLSQAQLCYRGRVSSDLIRECQRQLSRDSSSRRRLPEKLGKMLRSEKVLEGDRSL
jgi:hypothetical protein